MYNPNSNSGLPITIHWNSWISLHTIKYFPAGNISMIRPRGCIFAVPFLKWNSLAEQTSFIKLNNHISKDFNCLTFCIYWNVQASIFQILVVPWVMISGLVFPTKYFGSSCLCVSGFSRIEGSNRVPSTLDNTMSRGCPFNLTNGTSTPTRL